MNIILLLFLAFIPTDLTPISGGFDPIDSTFFVKLDKSHEAIVRRYIRENQHFGIQKDTAIICLSISNPYGNPDYHEIQIGATFSQDIFMREIPAYISQVGGYSVAVFFSWYKTCPGVNYPKAYLAKVRQLASKLRRKQPSPLPYENCQDWKVIFKKGEEPVVKILL